ncbi:MAG: DUF4838 domain-containing protein [Muribaculaceae bacterium]|nr:DUF4838 domain-containing protein [Muribaculaceae bacterium]
MKQLLIRQLLIVCTIIAPIFACTRGTKASAEDVNHAGDFEYREIYLPESSSAGAAALGLNNLDSDWGIWGHNLAKKLPKKHSESVYALVNGHREHDQLCFMSDDLYENLVDYINDTFDANVTTRFAILPYDNHLVCQCEYCVREGNTKDNAAPAVFNMITRLAQRFPKHQFFTSYYSTTKGLPTKQLPANAGVLISAMDYPLNGAATSGEQQFESLLQEWKRNTQRIYIWDYIQNFDDYFTPFPVFNIMQRRLQLYGRNGVKGVFLNGSGTDYSTFSKLHAYVLADLMNNPGADWQSLLKKYCKDFYPVTGNAIYDFIIAQENYARQLSKNLPLYEGIQVALQTYLPEAEFNAFYDKLRTLRLKAKGAERVEIDRLYRALALTKLELMRINGDFAGYEDHVDDLASLTDEGIEVYNEGAWEIASYVKDYDFMVGHYDEVNGTNLLKGVQLKPLTRLDEEYSDISILTDGRLGMPHNYHSGNMLVSSETALQIQIPKVDGMKRLRICFTRNPAYHIGRPVSVKLLDANGYKIVDGIKPEKHPIHSRHSFVDIDIPANAVGPFTVSVLKDPETKSMALDEIEAFAE